MTKAHAPATCHCKAIKPPTHLNSCSSSRLHGNEQCTACKTSRERPRQLLRYSGRHNDVTLSMTHEQKQQQRHISRTEAAAAVRIKLRRLTAAAPSSKRTRPWAGHCCSSQDDASSALTDTHRHQDEADIVEIRTSNDETPGCKASCPGPDAPNSSAQRLSTRQQHSHGMRGLVAVERRGRAVLREGISGRQSSRRRGLGRISTALSAKSVGL